VLQAGRRIGIVGPWDPDRKHQQGDSEGEDAIAEGLDAPNVAELQLLTVFRFAFHQSVSWVSL
jgi:hypothetical protein